MNTLTTIKSRRAVREWDSKAVPDEILNQILDAARFAPSPLNVQPWHFIVLRNEETIANVMNAAKHGTFAALAPVVIIGTALSAETADEWLYEHEPNIYNFSTVCAMSNMWLASSELNVGACWVTLDKDVARKLLAIPDTHQIVGSLALGYKKEPATTHKPVERRSLSELVSYEMF